MTTIKCLECGSEVRERITGVHLISKQCSGNLKNLTEYREKFPDAVMKSIDTTQLKSRIKLEYTEQDVLDGKAVKCKSCGFVCGRLQWTHFKHKCSGKYSNVQEYLIDYPNALTVAPSLAKRTAVTLDNLIIKYGEEEAQERWKQYTDLQAETNTFEFKNKKYGTTQEEFDDYNSSRASTKENLINRHGEELGTKKWEDYRIRQSYTTSVAYFIETYGEKNGLVKYENFVKARTIETGISNIEIEVYKNLSNILDGLSHQLFISDLHQYKSTTDDRFYRPYDYGNLEKLKLIEFYGTYWHFDPRFYSNKIELHDQINKKRASDKRKISFAKNLGFEVHIIWEHDWHTDNDNVITDVKEWWYGN